MEQITAILDSIMANYASKPGDDAKRKKQYEEAMEDFKKLTVPRISRDFTKEDYENFMKFDQYRFLHTACREENEKEGKLHLSDGYNCPKCKNRGMFSEPYFYLFWQLGSYNCSCLKIRKAINEFKRNGLSRMVEKYTFSSYNACEEWQKVILNKAKSYIKEAREPWFFFGGVSGCGKTHICTAITANLLKSGEKLHYMQWEKESKRLKQQINDYKAYYKIMDDIENCDILYIDDLFKCGRSEQGRALQPSSADINLAFEIINSRYMSGKRVIISSELTLGDIGQLDSAIAGRIKECAGEYIIKAEGNNKNYRLR